MQSLKNKSMLDQMYVDSILRSVFHKKWKYKTKSTKILPFFFSDQQNQLFFITYVIDEILMLC